MDILELPNEILTLILSKCGNCYGFSLTCYRFYMIYKSWINRPEQCRNMLKKMMIVNDTRCVDNILSLKKYELNSKMIVDILDVKVAVKNEIHFINNCINNDTIDVANIYLSKRCGTIDGRLYSTLLKFTFIHYLFDNNTLIYIIKNNKSIINLLDANGIFVSLSNENLMKIIGGIEIKHINTILIRELFKRDLLTDGFIKKFLKNIIEHCCGCMNVHVIFLELLFQYNHINLDNSIYRYNYHRGGISSSRHYVRFLNVLYKNGLKIKWVMKNYDRQCSFVIPKLIKNDYKYLHDHEIFNIKDHKNYGEMITSLLEYDEYIKYTITNKYITLDDIILELIKTGEYNNYDDYFNILDNLFDLAYLNNFKYENKYKREIFERLHQLHENDYEDYGNLMDRLGDECHIYKKIRRLKKLNKKNEFILSK